MMVSRLSLTPAIASLSSSSSSSIVELDWTVGVIVGDAIFGSDVGDEVDMNNEGANAGGIDPLKSVKSELVPADAPSPAEES
mmetsp:Transcript_24227/g.45075  ORF Transcript_24227/g.45075 Transcript_24227/m.45075 type:complete len:82 (-) Transcript_24227:435-680(-)